MPGGRPLIFFGSSMNPPTKAHKALVLYLIKSTQNLNPRPLIMIAPVYQHIFSKEDLADFDARFKLTQTQFKDEIEAGLVVVSDIEKRVSEGLSPSVPGTVDVLRYLKAHPGLYPEADVNHISLIMGGDVYEDFVNGLWKESSAVIELCDEIHVFSRPLGANSRQGGGLIRPYTHFEMSVGANIRPRRGRFARPPFAPDADLNKFKFHDQVINDPEIQKISSTKIRSDFQHFDGLEIAVLDQMMKFYPDLYPSTRAYKNKINPK